MCKVLHSIVEFLNIDRHIFEFKFSENTGALAGQPPRGGALESDVLLAVEVEDGAVVANFREHLAVGASDIHHTTFKPWYVGKHGAFKLERIVQQYYCE